MELVLTLCVTLQALVMYQLYDRGLVKSLDDPLSDYCTGFSMINPFDSKNITLRQIAAQVIVDTTLFLVLSFYNMQSSSMSFELHFVGSPIGASSKL